MNLKRQLFTHILIIAMICILASAAYVLYQTDQQSIAQVNTTAAQINEKLTEEILKNFKRYDHRTAFPNHQHWNEINSLPGSCVQFLSRTESRQRSHCNEINEDERNWPLWFGTLYNQFFSPGYEVQRKFYFNSLTYGTILVSLNRHAETARAWHNLQAVISIVGFTILALCILIFFTINRLLKPAQLIISDLEKMRQGQLDRRLPEFDVAEWRRTANAINALAAQQQQVLLENQQLAIKLLNVQEEEHRYIARELHDEFGQCLAGINAVTTSIKHSSSHEYPKIMPELEQIRHISEHMMTVLRSLLTRLRPADIDDIGLQRSLEKLIQSWRQRNGHQTLFHLSIPASLPNLPPPLPVNIYRIIQEALTNIAKHADATQVHINMAVINQQMQLIIEDNGQKGSETDMQLGMGLLGIHERVRALGGEIAITQSTNIGFRMLIQLPIPQEVQT